MMRSPGTSTVWLPPLMPVSTSTPTNSVSRLRTHLGLGSHLDLVFLPHGREEGVQRLRQRRVREDGLPEDRVGHSSHHGYLQHGGHLASLHAQDRAAQDLVGLRVHHGLHEAPGLVDLHGPGHVAHGYLGYANVEALLAGSCSLKPALPNCGSIKTV